MKGRIPDLETLQLCVLYICRAGMWVPSCPCHVMQWEAPGYNSGHWGCHGFACKDILILILLFLLIRSSDCRSLVLVVLLVLWLGLPRECADPGLVWVCIAALAVLNFLLSRNSGVTCEYCRAVCYVQVFSHILQGRSSECCCGHSANPGITEGSGIGALAAQSPEGGRKLGSQGCGMCVAGGIQELGGCDSWPMEILVCSSYQEVRPPWLQSYIYLEMYSKISASFLIWFALTWGEENHWSRGVGGFVWFPSQQKLKAIYSSHLAVLVVTRRRHLKVSGHVLPLGTEGAGFAFVQLQRWMSSPI